VSRLRQEIGERLDDRAAAIHWLESQGAPNSAALQIVEYLTEARRMLGVLPTQEVMVAERFFDESGGMQLVLHSPLGSRLNRAWGLALRKRFCRQFNFELQAAATEDAVLLSLGPQHSFPLESVFRFLQPATAREILVQALLDAPVFATRWRWNANLSLAVPRFRGGRKVPPQIQRMESEDLLAAAFPDAAACLENIPGDREIPDHPLVLQVIEDCLHEAMDLDGLLLLLERLERGTIRYLARDLPEPSPLAHEILNAKPYAFLDDAPLEERRTQAVQTRRAFEPGSADELGTLDQAAIDRVREEVWPEVLDPDELHDALMVSGFLTDAEGRAGREGRSWLGDFESLVGDRRAARLGDLWVAAERFPLALTLPENPEAIRELLRGRLEILGPVTAAELATSIGARLADVDAGLMALEGEGVVLRGRFSPGRGELEWCDRRLLARIHRYTLNRLRSEIAPVASADFQRFLFEWQRVTPEERAQGLEGIAAVLDQLDGYEVPAGAWESEVLGIRVAEYDSTLLDLLCLTGRVAWGRLSAPAASSPEGGTSPRPIRSSPVALFRREHAAAWLGLTDAGAPGRLSSYALAVLEVLTERGASFLPELISASGLLATQVEQALGELAAAGRVTSDSFAGLRALLTPASKRPPIYSTRRRLRGPQAGLEQAGRWSLLREEAAGNRHQAETASSLELYARTLLRRYGVVFHRLLARESIRVPWRDLLLIYRRLEARGEIRGGRFLAGVTGEQFALPEAVARLRAIRRREDKPGQLVTISAADPLNLIGIVTPGERIASIRSTRILFEDGVPLAVQEAGKVRPGRVSGGTGGGHRGEAHPNRIPGQFENRRAEAAPPDPHQRCAPSR
jgi:ATP-dependent Lhr-like helicase